ncbi:Rad52/Rad22 family DNA repair protein [Neptuniibacter sp.]|uniref:Rad52/Rad22 family DNA repair protein n=1 Tax=Neptuniibacter sp. TaxID=1962643 RepID=UPI00261F0F80|nr:Rad52/Rad22 family DNA repair protein [Neptuniibacter sp.]MCP4597031.1 hypothetical protein [Neptuniibacter sp.]
MEGKIKTLPKDVREKLREPMPPESISQHQSKKYLSTIKAIYIVERLNDVFGIGGWTLEHDVWFDEPGYVVTRGCIIIGEPYNFSTPMQYGGHKKTGTGTELADGYKSSVTDCQSKCASYLEVGIDVFKGQKEQPKTQAKRDTPQTQQQPANAQDDKEWDDGERKNFFGHCAHHKVEDKDAFKEWLKSATDLDGNPIVAVIMRDGLPKISQRGFRYVMKNFQDLLSQYKLSRVPEDDIPF